MKGRFRKGKKQFRAGRKGKLFNRYAAFLLKIERRRKNAVKLAQMALIQSLGMMQVQLVRSMPGLNPVDRSLKLAQIIVDTAHGITKIANEK